MEYTHLVFIATPRELKRYDDSILYELSIPNGIYDGHCHLIESKNSVGQTVHTLIGLDHKGEEIRHSGISFLSKKIADLLDYNREVLLDINCRYLEVLPGKSPYHHIVRCATTLGVGEERNFVIEIEEEEDVYDILYTFGKIEDGKFVNTTNIIIPSWENKEDNEYGFFKDISKEKAKDAKLAFAIESLKELKYTLDHTPSDEDPSIECSDYIEDALTKLGYNEDN